MTQPATSSTTPGRRAGLTAGLAAAGLDGLLVTDLINIRYLTGFTGSNAALLISVAGDEKSRFCTDFRYLTQSAAQVPDLERLIDRPCGPVLISTAVGRIGIESHAVTLDGYDELQAEAADAVELVPIAGLVEDLRAVKDEFEVDALRRACAIADQALAALIADGGLRPGRTEREAALDLDHRIRLLGADDISFETILASGENSAIPHHSPSDRSLRTGDLVKLDFGATVEGYHSDMTRTVTLGPAAGWQRELFALVSAAQQAGRDAMVVGTTGVDVDSAARSVIAAAGHADHFGHGLGHGVGLVIHEAPALAQPSVDGRRSRGDQFSIIRADMCVTVEPGVYLPGRGGVRIEDSGVVRPDGYEVLTLTTKELLEL